MLCQYFQHFLYFELWTADTIVELVKYFSYNFVLSLPEMFICYHQFFQISYFL